jgi:4-diphosphocytidyl-2-C-methyl-D-erythritol kinase
MINIKAPAKLNLFLRICGKNNAGYHLIDSLVAFTEYGDNLTVCSAEKDELVLTGEFAGTINTHIKNNLVIRALNAFRQNGGNIGPLRIILEKKVPVEAGLGGGSSNAAALLLALNEQSKTPLSQKNLYDIGLKLGADVPVCLARGCQRVANIGEVLTPHDLPKIGAVILVNPGVALSTKDVFKSFAQSNKKSGSGFGGPLSTRNVANIVGLGNDLTETAASLVPQIRRCLNELTAARGVVAAAMSGSGASCFAFFENKDAAILTAKQLQNVGYWAQVTRIV